MGTTWGRGPRWAPCWPHELCYLGWCFQITSMGQRHSYGCPDPEEYRWVDQFFRGGGTGHKTKDYTTVQELFWEWAQTMMDDVSVVSHWLIPYPKRLLQCAYFEDINDSILCLLSGFMARCLPLPDHIRQELDLCILNRVTEVAWIWSAQWDRCKLWQVGEVHHHFSLCSILILWWNIEIFPASYFINV